MYQSVDSGATCNRGQLGTTIKVNKVCVCARTCVSCVHKNGTKAQNGPYISSMYSCTILIAVAESHM